ncbi:MAG: energy-coupling factor ABC transporter substrate-binding protein [Candidatus Competibacteraceae bacterium]|nr:energy-coupling factor ABC transporter substrate-binding protein [Candidatus Competibacteraceae bacterium]MBK7983177.1 energy-coupling factor ABC transporter substrate-binding protein [Candidatus Competibacteraceae bacterium]MBK8898275.1 energy-coupling factor ABC transporter substrate-binding protein [Candidatus Competibacteraceae bacterium]MBK8962082.1 energy-coupling factor ABC transporter substrate-binding protein [Candidatus Competibacteraceae bacterium]MBK9951294.1 energy-coupling fact
MKAHGAWWLLLLVVILAGSVWIGGRRQGAEFAGSDSQAVAVVAALQPAYRPWFDSVWKPPPELASGLFALQAALGAGVLGYYLGFKRGQARARRERADAGD